VVDPEKLEVGEGGYDAVYNGVSFGSSVLSVFAVAGDHEGVSIFVIEGFVV